MDPIFADGLRQYLEQLNVDHAANGAVCTCGVRMAAGRASHLLDVIASAVVPLPAAPHIVHVASAIVGIADGGRKYAGSTDCPDCTRGLSSRGFDMICQRLSRTTALQACHEGCVIACGVPHG